MSLKQKLNSLYTQQRQLTGASSLAQDPRIKKTLEFRQQLLGRRIGRYQAEEKKEEQ